MDRNTMVNTGYENFYEYKKMLKVSSVKTI